MMSASPELMAAVRDPGVRRLMADPGNLAQLAAMLRDAAKHVAAQPSPSPDGSPVPPQPHPGA